MLSVFWVESLHCTVKRDNITSNTNFTHRIYARFCFTHGFQTGKWEQEAKLTVLGFGLVTLGGHRDDGLRRGVVLVLHPRVVLVQELRQRWRFGQQLADHVPADVRSLLEPQDAEDLGLDDVEPHLLTVLPEVAGRALLSALRQ